MAQSRKRGIHSRYTPTPEDRLRVETAVFFGHTHAEIATIIINRSTGEHISVDTLSKYYHDELKAGGARTTQMVAESLFRSAMKGDTKAGIFLLKARKQWRDENRGAIEGTWTTAKNSDTQPGILVLPADLPDDEWERAAQDHQKAILAAEAAETS